MKAIRVHTPGEADVLRLEELPEPRPGAGEALVRVEAAGLNFIEIYQRKDRKSTRLNSSHIQKSRMPSSA